MEHRKRSSNYFDNDLNKNTGIRIVWGTSKAFEGDFMQQSQKKRQEKTQ